MNWTVISTLIGIALGALSILLALKYRRRKLLCFDYVGNALFLMVCEDEDLQVSYLGQTAKQVINRQFFLWNPGNEAIRDTDIRPSEKISFRLGSESKIINRRFEVFGAIEGFRSVPIVGGIQIEFEVFDARSGVIIDFTEVIPPDGSHSEPLLVGHVFESTEPIRRVPVADLGWLRFDNIAWPIMAVLVSGFALAAISGGGGYTHADKLLAYLIPVVLAVLFSVIVVPRLLLFFRYKPPSGMRKI